MEQMCLGAELAGWALVWGELTRSPWTQPLCLERTHRAGWVWGQGCPGAGTRAALASVLLPATESLLRPEAGMGTCRPGSHWAVGLKLPRCLCSSVAEHGGLERGFEALSLLTRSESWCWGAGVAGGSLAGSACPWALDSYTPCL